MKKMVPIREALETPDLLGHALGGETWHAWRAVLIALAGEALTPEELATFRKLTKREEGPTYFVEEFLGLIGRRGGKTRAMAALAAYLATMVDWSDKLAAGERGLVLLIAADMRQARIALDYIAGMIQASPLLCDLIASTTADAISLTNGIDIEVRAASFRRLRGVTAVAILADEICFWPTDEASTNPDSEILNAARPALATTGGPLVMISSPYARRGEAWETYRRHFGPKGDPAILVAQAASRDLNPSLPQRVVDRALERDRAAAAAEYLGQFRNDLEAFVSREVVEACVSPGIFERPPVPGGRFVAFVDPAGGSGADSMTLAIAHAAGNVAVLDAIREVRPPFSPEAVVEDFARLLKDYRISRVTGDRYAGEWPREAFRRHHISYDLADRPRSELYRDLLPRLNSRTVDLLDNERLVGQLINLERRTTRTGRDYIDSPPNGHEDVANAVAGVLTGVTLARRGISMVDYVD